VRGIAAARSLGVGFVREQQVVGGVPVLGAERVVTKPTLESPGFVVDHTRGGIHAPGAATVSVSDAIEAGTRSVDATVFRAPPSASLAILPQGSGQTLVWRVLLPTASPLASFEVLVDARTGRVLRIRDRLRRFVTGHALIYDPNPVEENGGTTGLADNNDADSPLLESLRRPVTLERMNGDCLDGEWVKAVLPAGDPDASDASGNVCAAGTRNFDDVKRSNDKFEALMAYFHIDRTQAYIESLGFANIVNRQLQVNADAAFGSGDDDNSFYDSSTGQISFGPGGVDDAEDADVIVHEYGHAIQDSQVPGFGEGDDAGAIGEGWGDYLAADQSATFTPSPVFDPCFAEWDSIPDPCLRRVDSTQTLSQVRASPSCAADVHCVGQVWSSALWALRGALGAPAADRLILQSQFSLAPDTTFDEASRALLAADASLNASANRPLLLNILSSRGLVDVAHLDDAPDGADPISVPGSASGTLDATADVHDFYRLDLTAGHGVRVKLSGAGDFDLRLYRGLDTSTIVGGSTTAGTSTEAFSYVPPVTGAYFLDVGAESGSGAYTLETAVDIDGDGVTDAADNCPSVANRNQTDSDHDHLGDACDTFPLDAANDADHDGIGANADNCPKVANRNQRDWNRNGLGDACDRSSRITISSVSVRGHRVSVSGTVRPLAVGRTDWTVFAQRKGGCTRCRFTRAARLQGARRITSGRIRFTFVLARPGTYRLFALLTDPHYRVARSRTATIRIRS
jgi:hypothetical protein